MDEASRVIGRRRYRFHGRPTGQRLASRNFVQANQGVHGVDQVGTLAACRQRRAERRFTSPMSNLHRRRTMGRRSLRGYVTAAGGGYGDCTAPKKAAKKARAQSSQQQSERGSDTLPRRSRVSALRRACPHGPLYFRSVRLPFRFEALGKGKTARRPS